MRRLLVVLLVANLAVAALWAVEWLGNGREPQRLAAQVAADKVRVVPLERFDAARGAQAPRPD